MTCLSRFNRKMTEEGTLESLGLTLKRTCGIQCRMYGSLNLYQKSLVCSDLHCEDQSDFIHSYLSDYKMK